jgi:Glycine zipper
LLAYSEVNSLRVDDRLHGARNGALIGGIPSFVLGFIVGKAFDPGPVCDKPATGGGCPARPNTTVQGLELGGVGALIGAAVGGAIGALVGYEDRYVVEQTETASAR